jgi:hypothetical protein
MRREHDGSSTLCYRVYNSGQAHSSALSLMYFHNAESFMSIMRQSIGARYDHRSEKPSGRSSAAYQNAWRNAQSANQAEIDLISLDINIYQTSALLAGPGKCIVTGVQCSILPET